MSILPRRVQYGKHCLVYCGDDQCDCPRGPLGYRPLSEVVSRFPYIGPPDDNFHQGSDFHDQLPEDGSPQEFYVISFSVDTVLFRTNPDARSISHASTIDEYPSPVGPGSRVQVQHKLRVRRRWLPISQMPADHVALLGCDRYPRKQYWGHSREIKPGSVLVQMHADGPRDWKATHYDRTSLKKIVVRSQTAPHGAERRVPRKSELLAAPYGSKEPSRRVPRLAPTLTRRNPED